MKKTTCAEMSGDATCTEVFVAPTAKEMIDIAWKHMQEKHPEAVAKIMANPKEENDKWMADFETNFGNLPDAE